jgi:hypothetical protein
MTCVSSRGWRDKPQVEVSRSQRAGRIAPASPGIFTGQGIRVTHRSRATSDGAFHVEGWATETVGPSRGHVLAGWLIVGTRPSEDLLCYRPRIHQVAMIVALTRPSNADAAELLTLACSVRIDVLTQGPGLQLCGEGFQSFVIHGARELSC